MNTRRTKRTAVNRAEMVLVLACAAVIAAVSIHFDAFEMIVEMVEAHDSWQLDEYLIVLAFGGLASLILLFRRAGDLRREIVRREQSEQLATKLARHDPLTGLPNRRVMAEDLNAAIASVQDRKAECAVFLIDLDLFKPINDVHGHGAGDAVLIEVAARLSQVIGSGGTVARMGGDEFACVVSYQAGGDTPTRLAAQILRSLRQPIIAQGITLQLGCTIGIARAPHDGTTGSVLLHGADLAMYKGKREGGGVYHFFDQEMDVQLRDRAALEMDLRMAAGAGQIIPFFQPIMDLSDDRILGFEALARWMHPSRGMILPETFIPIAEDLGIIDEITNVMLRDSCIAARDWPSSFWVSVNISPLQLKDPWLAVRLLGILADTGFAPGRLVVEVTENAVIEDIMNARAIFSSLQGAGVRIALDDFGKGYSSLYHLRQLQFDQLKIDGSFVHSMNSPESAKIVNAVAGLGKSLGMLVTAEGVETSDEADALRALGCERGQGFLFGKPLDAAATIELLSRNPPGKISALRSA